MEPPSKRYLSVKRPLSILIFIQLLLAVNLFAENSLVLTRDRPHFSSETVRNVVLVAWLMCLFWLITIVSSISVLFTNNFYLLIPHIAYSSLLSLVAGFFSLALLLSHSGTLATVYLFSIFILLSISIYYETQCFIDMRSTI